MNMDHKDFDEIFSAGESYFNSIPRQNSPIIVPDPIEYDEEMDPFDEEDIPSYQYKKLRKIFTPIGYEGVLKYLVTPGNGNKIPKCARVKVHYTNWIEDSEIPIFSTNMEPLVIKMYQENVFGFFDYIVSTMEEKEISYYLVDAENAFGNAGSIGLIPQDATLLFKIEVIDFFEVLAKNDAVVSNNELHSEIERLELSLKELKITAAEQLKKDNVSEAIHIYEKALDALDVFCTSSKPHLDYQMQEMFNIFNNIALCYKKLNNWKKVIKYCTKAIQLPQLDVDYGKLYYRYGIALSELGKTEEALKKVELALEHKPGCNEIVFLRSKIIEKLKEEDKTSKELYKKMMNSK